MRTIHRFMHGLLLVVALSTLQGCFPIVAAGLGAGALAGADRRTLGSQLEDNTIETKAAKQIRIQYPDTVHVSVTSFNRHLLLTGEVPNEEIKAAVEKIASDVANVTAVSNELVVGELSGLTKRSNDSLITSNVKLRFLNNKLFQPDHVKVVTEANVVFLMGLVYRKEADAAAEIASNSKSVDRVVTVFEYLD